MLTVGGIILVIVGLGQTDHLAAYVLSGFGVAMMIADRIADALEARK